MNELDKSEEFLDIVLQWRTTEQKPEFAGYFIAQHPN